jgi:predicted membrane protein
MPKISNLLLNAIFGVALAIIFTYFNNIFQKNTEKHPLNKEFKENNENENQENKNTYRDQIVASSNIYKICEELYGI